MWDREVFNVSCKTVDYLSSGNIIIINQSSVMGQRQRKEEHNAYENETFFSMPVGPGYCNFRCPACSLGPSDEALTKSIESKFYAEPQLKAAPIQIAVAKGEATLSGEVSSEDIRQKALETARVTEGIRKVNDLMKVMITIPAGTEVQVTMIDSINSKSSQVGSLFRSSLHVPITSGDQVIIPGGIAVYVKLVHAKSAGSIKGSSELEVILDHLVTQGESIPLDSSTVRQKGASRGKQTAKRSAIVGGAGAILGGIIGGGKGAAIGASVGAGGTRHIRH